MQLFKYFIPLLEWRVWKAWTGGGRKGQRTSSAERKESKSREQRNTAILISSLAPQTVWVRSSRGQLDLGSKSTFWGANSRSQMTHTGRPSLVTSSGAEEEWESICKESAWEKNLQSWCKKHCLRFKALQQVLVMRNIVFECITINEWRNLYYVIQSSSAFYRPRTPARVQKPDTVLLFWKNEIIRLMVRIWTLTLLTYTDCVLLWPCYTGVNSKEGR